MKISREQLRNAAEEGIISIDQVDDLFSYLRRQPDTGPSFNFTNILYYFGGLVAIGAMTLFMNLGWEEFGGWGILYISIAYAGIGLILVGKFQQKIKTYEGLCLLVQFAKYYPTTPEFSFCIV